MSVDDFRQSLFRFEKVKIDEFLKKYQVNILENDLGCVNVELF